MCKQLGIRSSVEGVLITLDYITLHYITLFTNTQYLSTWYVTTWYVTTWYVIWEGGGEMLSFLCKLHAAMA